jgi:hypothetical protein
MRSALAHSRRASASAVSPKKALGIRDWQAMFVLMFGFLAHFATQNRAFCSNLLSCASQIPLQSHLPWRHMRSALTYPKQTLLCAVSLKRALGIRDWQAMFVLMFGFNEYIR